jgi:hypothetical protein
MKFGQMRVVKRFANYVDGPKGTLRHMYLQVHTAVETASVSGKSSVYTTFHDRRSSRG